MSHSPETTRLSLRERKKIRIRAAIRDHAMRLFLEQGYAATTVEQIAGAADVSPSTFFRYFPSKEAVVLADDLDSPMLRALQNQPPGLGPFATMRAAMQIVLAGLSAEDYDREMARTRLILAEPELRSTVANEFSRTVDMYARVLAERAGRVPEDFEVRAFAGALVGAMHAVSVPPADLYSSGMRVLDYLEAGMSL